MAKLTPFDFTLSLYSNSLIQLFLEQTNYVPQKLTLSSSRNFMVYYFFSSVLLLVSFLDSILAQLM